MQRLNIGLTEICKLYKHPFVNLVVNFMFLVPHYLKRLQLFREEMAIDAVYFNRSYHPEQRLRDEEFAKQLFDDGLNVKTI